MDYIWLAFFLFLGVFMLLKPELLWKVENLLTVKGGEPTEFYLSVMRLTGIFAMFCSIVILIHIVLG